MPLTVIGLGPGPAELLTLEAQQRLASAQEVYLRTTQHPAVSHLPAHLVLHSFDAVNGEQPTSGAASEAIVQQIWSLAQRPEGVVYAVPGHPLMGDATVALLRQRCAEAKMPVEIVTGVSFLEPVLQALALEPTTAALLGGSGALQMVDALQPVVDPARPALVTQVCNPEVASRLKQQLSKLYPADHQVVLVSTGEAGGGVSVRRIAFEEIDRDQPGGMLTCLYLPPLAFLQNVSTFDGLAAIVAHLRSPEGCPWDREQTHASLQRYLLEEAYETITALDRNDVELLREELGDLLLNILLQCQVASEAGEFEASDMIRGIAQKLIRRHPHVFGDLKVSNAQQVMDNWEIFKSKERGQHQSMLEGLPDSLPALAYTRSLHERLAPLQMVAEEQGPSLESAARDAEDLGRSLFKIAFRAAAAGWDPEEALRLANDAFRRRAQRAEELAWERGTSLQELSQELRAELWRSVTEERS